MADRCHSDPAANVMPCRYDLYPDLNLAVFTYEGVLRAPEIVANADRVESDPGYTATINELADFRRIETVDIDQATLANLSGLLMGLYLRAARNKRIAMLVQDPEVRPLADAFTAVISSNTQIRIEVFESLDAALGFLKLARGDLPEASSLLTT